MRLSFLELAPEDRSVYFVQAATNRGLSPVIMEKDFWVCWMLAVLFDSRFSDHLVFKGGTSLSKVFGVIKRFSEDIDLSLSPEFVGVPDVELGLSRNQATKWMAKAEAACAAAVQEQVQPELEAIVTEVLGDGRWLEFEIDATTNSPVIFFHYPTTQPTGFAYLGRSVKMEFGSLTDQRPAGLHPVRPWLAEEVPSEFGDWHCEVVSLELERTFWEKATILHAEYHRDPDTPAPDRYSRHYADVAALADHPAGAEAVGRHDLRERVVEWKSQFFASAWARYDLAQPGTFKLVPPEARMAALRGDYRAMRDMYLGEPAEFDAIMATLAGLDRKINEDVVT